MDGTTDSERGHIRNTGDYGLGTYLSEWNDSGAGGRVTRIP